MRDLKHFQQILVKPTTRTNPNQPVPNPNQTRTNTRTNFFKNLVKYGVFAKPYPYQNRTKPVPTFFCFFFVVSYLSFIEFFKNL